MKHRVRMAAIFILLFVTTYCLPSELLAARPQALAPPSRQAVSGVFSDFVLLDQPRTAFLNIALGVLQGNGRQHTSLWTFTYPDVPPPSPEPPQSCECQSLGLPSQTQRAIDPLGLDATRLTSVQKRGRWVAMSSVVATRTTGNRVAKLQEHQRALFRICEQRVEDFIYGRGEALHLTS